MSLNSCVDIRCLWVILLFGFLGILFNLLSTLSISSPTYIQNVAISYNLLPDQELLSSTPALKDNISLIIDMQLLWKCLYYDLILHPQFLSQTAFYPKPNVQKTCEEYEHFNKSLNIQYYIDWTHAKIATLNLTAIHHHRHVLAIRRYIMLLSNVTQNNNSTSQLLHRLSQIDSKHRAQLSTLLQSKEKLYFLLHTPKCAGTTICSTFNSLGFKTTGESFNCNIKITNSAWKHLDFGARTCVEYYKTARHKFKIDILGYERVMHGHSASSIPTLCDQFVYILPLRDPLKRIFSFLEQIILKSWRQPSDLIVQREFKSTLKQAQAWWIKQIYSISHQSTVCEMKVFEVEDDNQTHWLYTPLYIAEDFKGFFKALLYDNDSSDVLTEINMTSHRKRNCARPNGLYKIYWFGDKPYHTFGFKVKKQWDDARNQRIEGVTLDFLKGLLLNLYVRSFGFEHKEDIKKVTHDAYYAKNNEITVNHFLNAVDFLMMVDYVLPFERSLNHPMWMYLLQKLQSNKTNATSWLHANSVTQRKWNVKHETHPINTVNIGKQLLEDEIQMLRDENQLDIWLYDIANDIANVDATFLI